MAAFDRPEVFKAQSTARNYIRAEGDFKEELRPQEQNEKTKSCRENLWNEIQLKGPKRQK